MEETYYVGRHKRFDPETGVWQFWQTDGGALGNLRTFNIRDVAEIR